MTEHTTSDTAYHRRLDDRLTTIATTSGATVRSVLRAARGAFPTVAYERLRHLGLADDLPEGDPASVDAAEAVRTPELHPLDFEWYFTDDSVAEIAAALRDAGNSVLCLGAPTVAAHLARRGVPVTLVDRNDLFETRFETDLDSLRFCQADIHEPLPLESTFPVVFFDPPWYPEHTEAWLYRACQHVRPGARLYFVLFPPLVRPAALAQRTDLLETARRVGRVSVDDDAIGYHTPAFERRVLQDSDAPVVANWRHADLASVDVSEPGALAEPPTVSGGSEWDTFVTDGQVVKLRRTVTGGTTDVLAPIDGCDGYVLPSVSRRDARRQNVDLWTSRNRVATVGDRAVVAEGLRLLETGTDRSALSAAEFSTAVPASRKETLVTELDAILE
ncbi:hypothetical protein [Natrinema ejinorense]|uniref:Methyltransferase n=1 Tax=Natrinema ejinorense TaxID=373386 RepID=A0A2A5QTX4_9EURY|nr:hypothetical protein [Natrinema ejinorense]PCR90291.1 hypothetical protein CP557_06895 [Natrinema ejinorense]